MNTEIKKEWIEALRSNKYKQGRNFLRAIISAEDRYCCLGVLCDIVKEKMGTDWDLATFNNDTTVYRFSGLDGALNKEILEFVELPTKSGLVEVDIDLPNAELSTLAELNDAGYTFTDIAKVIEENL